MLGVVERSVTDGREDLADDEQRVAVQVVCRRARHDHCTRQVEAGEDDRHQGTAQFVDVEPEADAQERVDQVSHSNLYAEGRHERENRRVVQDIPGWRTGSC